MSQLKFQDNHDPKNRRLVQTGYDRPLGYIHFTVFDKHGDVVYSELDMPSPFKMSVEDVLSACKRLNIDYPDNFEERLRAHVNEKMGNHVEVLPNVPGVSNYAKSPDAVSAALDEMVRKQRAQEVEWYGEEGADYIAWLKEGAIDDDPGELGEWERRGEI